ncbi:MAG: FHA domain-containing serine/threonine-protein kinase [Pirellulaceae bacterium]
MTWFIEYTTGDSKQAVRLDLPTEKVMKIGRGSASDTKIQDATLSRIHCEVELVQGMPLLRDLGSTGGTLVAGRRIAEQVLHSGQSFKAGNTKFVVTSDSPLDAPTLQPRGRRGMSLQGLIERFEAKPSIDRFEIKKLVNRGGKSLVYRAVDSTSGDEVALKVIPTPSGSEEDKARFMRAMKMLQELRDPYLVKLLRAGRTTNYCWVAMEWLKDGSIADRVERQGIGGCLDWRDAWQIAVCISQSLHILERHGIVHRNIRPTNILHRGANNTWLLSDLVVAKADASSDASVTQQFFLPHDVAYTAPERLLGKEDNAHSLQADIYSLGAVLTETLTGEPPYGHGDLLELQSQIRQPRKLVTRAAQIGVNELFVDFVNRLTEPDPAKRMRSATELWQQAERVGKLSGLSSV